MNAFSEALTALGTDHIRLAYHYADVGDADAYGSLLDTDVDIEAPGFLYGRGRAEVQQQAARLVPGQTRHQIHLVIADQRSIVVVGTARTGHSAATTEFTDVFILSRDALILRQRRYLARRDTSTNA
ncbi:nuclear transport factor 2 family protein (plasmid) [Streptomyces sp. NBC_01216]|uniref:nuclear transport factor 2 family protein n=1 Tax=Streptomyces sp. NBC_01216 TaxID=2903778 RepID=UPI002E158A85|nr:nuclear transport factor 2 family protein [Streptomyces sp. NBC_01216]